MKINYLENKKEFENYYKLDSNRSNCINIESGTNLDNIKTPGTYVFTSIQNMENFPIADVTDYFYRSAKLIVESTGISQVVVQRFYISKPQRHVDSSIKDRYNRPIEIYIRYYTTAYGNSSLGWGNWIKLLTQESVLESIYPVGSIYMSVNSIIPDTLFGGVWEQIKDTFLLSVGDTFVAGDTGGEIAHVLTESEMPSHYHTTRTDGNDLVALWRPNADGNSNWQLGGNNMLTGSSIETDSKGQNFAHNNMPPYLTVYMWKRIA